MYKYVGTFPSLLLPTETEPIKNFQSLYPWEHKPQTMKDG